MVAALTPVWGQSQQYMGRFSTDSADTP